MWVTDAVIKSQSQHVLMSQEASTVRIKPGQLLGKAGLENLLESCAPTPEQPASSVYISPGPLQPLLESSGTEGLAWWEHLRLMGPSVLNSDTGIVALRGGSSALVVVPPFPLSENRLIPGWDLSSLRSLLATEHTVGVILLRLGRFSVAVYQGERLLSSKNRCPVRQRPASRRWHFPTAVSAHPQRPSPTFIPKDLSSSTKPVQRLPGSGLYFTGWGKIHP